MNVVDSSGWLEFFGDGPNAEFFAVPIQETEALIVPSISLLEVFKKTLRLRGEGKALEVVAAMQEGKVIELDANLVLIAAKMGLEERLPLTDSVMLATARAFQATLWTQDSDFEGREGVRYIPHGG